MDTVRSRPRTFYVLEDDYRKLRSILTLKNMSFSAWLRKMIKLQIKLFEEDQQHEASSNV